MFLDKNGKEYKSRDIVCGKECGVAEFRIFKFTEGKIECMILVNELTNIVVDESNSTQFEIIGEFNTMHHFLSPSMGKPRFGDMIKNRVGHIFNNIGEINELCTCLGYETLDKHCPLENAYAYLGYKYSECVKSDSFNRPLYTLWSVVWNMQSKYDFEKFRNPVCDNIKQV